jgi:hypothetical protein
MATGFSFHDNHFLTLYDAMEIPFGTWHKNDKLLNESIICIVIGCC